MVLDAYKIASGVVADFPGLDVSVIHSRLKLILEEHEAEIASIGKPFGMAKKICSVLCDQERARQLASSDQYVYKRSDVRKALERVFTGPLDRRKVPDDYRSEGRSSDGCDFRADIQRVFKRLPVKYQVALLRMYGLNDPIPNGSYDRKLCDKGVKLLVAMMNGAPVPAQKPKPKPEKAED